MPDDWVIIEITNLDETDAVNEHNYTLICIVEAIEGMNIAPEVDWYHPNGSLVETGERLTVGPIETEGTVTILTLKFSPVLQSHDDGGVYSCRAQVTVPWMITQPPVRLESVNMVVISKLLSLMHVS